MRWAGHVTRMWETTNDKDNDKPIKSLLKGKGLLPPVGLARIGYWWESQKERYH
jgi:hypothetical protein